MKALICCDEHGLIVNGKYYLKNFDTILAYRYLDVFDTIKLIIRIEKKSEINLHTHKIVSDKRIEIVPVPFFQGPISFFKNFFRINKSLKNISNDCSLSIIRIPSTIGFMVYFKFRNKFNVTGFEILANPLELFQNKKWSLSGLFYYSYHIMQKHCCKNGIANAYVTSYTLQKVYKPGKKTLFTTNFSSVNILKKQFTGFRDGILDIGNIKICHVSHPIRTNDKGHIQVIDMIADLRSKNYPVRATFAGDGDKIDSFKAYASSKNVEKYISFVGFLEYNQLFELLKKSDIMVFPTVSEGLPRVIIEAMAVGLPCISTPIGGIPELIDDEFLIPINRVKSYVEKIIECIDDNALYIKTSQKNYNKSLEYEAENLKKKRIEFYKFLKNNV